MIHLAGYTKVIQSIYDYSQDQVFRFWDDCSEAEKKILLDELSRIDFQTLASFYASTREPSLKELPFGPPSFIALPCDSSAVAERDKAKKTGADFLHKGKVAVFMVAGGQGSRLGFEGPKGSFRLSSVKNKTLFQLHAQKIVKYSFKYGCSFPFFIMTSAINHEETVEHFEKHEYYGLDKKNVFFFQQNMLPSVDSFGKLILSQKNRIAMNPDGHGGSLTALRTSGALDSMKKQGIEIISYFQVDNPAVNIIDPVFIGYHLQKNAEVSSKALCKVDPEEKIGSFVRYSNGKEGIIEYSDLSDVKKTERNADGSLTFGIGSIAVHLFNRAFVERITASRAVSLPIHAASKKIKQYAGEEKDKDLGNEKKSAEVEGYKFEKFVFDALPLARKSCIIETLRSEEFAPVKNASGSDSPETSRKILDDLYRSWCASRSIIVPADVKVLEISPIVAVEAEDLSPGLIIPATDKVYIG